MSSQPGQNASQPTNGGGGGSSGADAPRWGTNDQGNNWFHRGPDSYRYSNKDGSYYYKNPDGSDYHKSKNGDAKYKRPDGSGWSENEGKRTSKKSGKY